MPQPDPMPESDLERALVRRSVSALSAGRCQCADCGRTPLIGEHVHLYKGAQTVCELCRLLRRGTPEHTELVRHSEHGLTVRLHRAA